MVKRAKPNQITAVEMAKNAGVSAKLFRRALRAENFGWHHYYARWTVARDGREFQQMRMVLSTKLRQFNLSNGSV